MAATLRRDTGARVPKRQVAQLLTRAATDFDALYQCRPPATVPEVRATGEILVLSSDGKGVPMLKADLRELTREAAAARQPRLRHRRSKGEKPHTKRMGTVAAVYTIAPFVRTPEEIVKELRPDPARLPVTRPRPEGKRVSRERQTSAGSDHPPGL